MKMLDYKKIGLYLLEKRKLYQLTQKQLADQLNISFQAISRWEKGLSIPSVDLLNELANLFQITVDEILKGEDKWPVFSYEQSGVDVTKIDLVNSYLSTQPSENSVFSRLFACVILKPYVFSLVFALTSRNKGKFCF